MATKMKRKIIGFLIVCLFVGLVNVEATTKTLTPDASKSGCVLSDGSYVQTGSTSCFAGDHSANKGYRGFLTFDLSTLPAGADITDVKLDLTSSTITGDPFGGLGIMYVEQVRYGNTLDKNDYSIPSVKYLLGYSGKPTIPVSGTITDALKNELSLGYTRFQVRVRFAKTSDNDGKYDWIRFTNPKLTITYTTGVTSATLQTDKSTYPPGETVHFTLKNTGTTDITSTDANPWGIQKYISGSWQTCYFSGVWFAPWTIHPGESKTWSWNQTSNTSISIDDANYRVKVTIGSNTWTDNFKIESGPPLNVNTWVDKGCGSTYNIDDPIKIYFEVNKACYITIEVTTSEGTKTTVPSQSVTAGTHYTSGVVGAPTGEHKLTISASVGSENASDTCIFYAKENTGDIKVIVKDQDENRIEDANVYLDGSYKGKTNPDGEYTISGLSPGNYTVKASKSGYEEDSESVHVEAGETDTVYLTLEEIPSSTPTSSPTPTPTTTPTTPAPTGMLSLSKPQYKQGEAVEMYLESTGTTPIQLPNTAPWAVYKIEGGLFEIYTPTSAEVITEVTGHMSWIWDQKNNLGERVSEGSYKIVLHTINAGEYSASFTITGEVATEPPVTQPPTTQQTTTESPLSSLLENPIVLIGGALVLLLLVLIIAIAVKK